MPDSPISPPAAVDTAPALSPATPVAPLVLLAADDAVVCVDDVCLTLPDDAPDGAVPAEPAR